VLLQRASLIFPVRPAHRGAGQQAQLL